MESHEKQPTPTRGIPVLLDRERYLRYTMGDLWRIQEEFGDDALTQEMQSGKKLAKLLWYGLKRDDPDLKVEDIGDLIDARDISDLVEAMGKAMRRRKAPEDPSTPAPTTPEAATGPQ